LLGFASLHILANNYQPLKWALAIQGIGMESTTNKKLTRGSTFIAGGVCAGLAKYYGISKGGVQAGFVVGSLFFGVTVLLYLILWGILPKES
jgi:phage shock protein PspC (stress-responsive transcriptional regulator)